MATPTRVWLHNTAYASEQAWRDEGPHSKLEVSTWRWWNLWQRRAPGWDLANGASIVLVSSWPGGGRLEWIVQAKEVVNLETPDWRTATKQIADWAHMDVRRVRREPYTEGKNRPGRFLVLAWAATKPVRLDVDKPVGLSMGRNGWLLKDAAWLKAVAGVTVKPQRQPGPPPRTRRASGQGRRSLAAANRAVEKRAEDVALAWCRSYGLRSLRRTGATQPWDLEGSTAAGSPRYVEVKGLTGGLGKVDVTSGEVKAARRHGDAHLLVVVHSIDLDLSTTPPTASGGELVVYAPWRPDDSELIETRYTWARSR